MKDPQSNESYEFGRFRLDGEKRRLWRGEELIPLTPKEFELLHILVENAGRVLEKDELHEKIWKDTFVEDGTLTRNVSWLRKKLGEGDDGGDKFIETYPKRGYRFLPEVIKSPKGNLLVVEEQTRTRIQVQETISLSESPAVETAAAMLSEGHRTRVPRWLWLVLGGVTLAAIGLVAYQKWFIQAERKIIRVSKVVPFSGLTGRESLPAFSPDGKQIAFVWNGGEHEWMDVYVRLVGAGEPVRLTQGKTNSLFPVFSPDGKYVAFFRSFPDTSVIYQVPALGGAERKIAEVRSGGTSFSLSPDGNTIAVADTDSTSSRTGIFLVNSQTGAKQRLTTPPDDLLDREPCFSPDGKSIAFVRSGLGYRDLYIVPTTGNELPHRLTDDKASQIRGLTWTADGKHIIFSSNRGDVAVSNLWQISMDGGEAVPILTSSKNPFSPAVSRDGRRIAYVEASEDVNIWRLNLSPTGIESKKLIASALSDHSQQISPDGNKIVFASDRSGDSEIWVTHADGSNPLQLTTSGSAGSPRFSPDSRFIAYGRNTESKDDIFVIDSDGGQPRMLTNNPARDVLPSWSADGRFIYFASNRSGDFQIWRMAAKGGEPTQITHQGGFETFASPDGKVIFYSKGRGTPGLWSVGIDGGAEQPVAELREAGYWRSWTVTQSGICYIAYPSNASYQIKFFSFSDRQTKEVATTDKTPLSTFSGLSASANAEWILYAQQDQSASGIVLADFEK